MLAKQVDGIILFPNSKNSNLYKDLIKIGYPIVFVDRKIANVPIDSVLMDNFEAVNLAMQEFIDKRYRKIGLVSPSTACQKITPRIERIKSYKQFLTNYKIKFNAEYLIVEKVNKIQRELEKMMLINDPPDALLATNDFVLLEILKFIKKHDIKIPDNLALIGIDDVNFASFYNPAITTVEQPIKKMGVQAAKLLLKKVTNDLYLNNSAVYRLKPRLIKRFSL